MYALTAILLLGYTNNQPDALSGPPHLKESEVGLAWSTCEGNIMDGCKEAKASLNALH